MHSLGMGFTVSHGVTATVSEAAATEVAFNRQVFDFATVRSVAEALSSRSVRISLENELPLSGGFGLSGASALATAFALDAASGLGLEKHTLGMTAHVAEVQPCLGGARVGDPGVPAPPGGWKRKGPMEQPGWPEGDSPW